MSASTSKTLKGMWANMDPEEKQRRMGLVSANRPKARSYPHGDENCFRQGCRCLPCRAASAECESERRRQRKGQLKGSVRPGRKRDEEVYELAEKLGVRARTIRRIGKIEAHRRVECGLPCNPGRPVDAVITRAAELLGIDRKVAGKMGRKKMLTKLRTNGLRLNPLCPVSVALVTGRKKTA